MIADKLHRTAIVTTLFLLLVMSSGCSAQDKLVTATDNGREITLRQGEMLSITLESNPTTGYSWQVIEIDNAVLKPQGDPEYHQASGSESLVGAGGEETFRFETVNSGKARLKLGYMRPWEDVPPIEIFVIQVIVK